MACLAFRKLLSSTVVSRSVHPAAAYRLFNTKSDDERPLVVATGGRVGWDVKEKEDTLHVRIDMPGLSREDVRMSLKKDTLVIKGEGEEGRKFSSRIELPDEEYKADEIKAEMRNGVLRVVVPKIIQRDRYDDLHIQID